MLNGKRYYAKGTLTKVLLIAYNGIVALWLNHSHDIHISGVHVGFSEGRGPNFRKGANQYKTKKKRI